MAESAEAVPAELEPEVKEFAYGLLHCTEYIYIYYCSYFSISNGSLYIYIYVYICMYVCIVFSSTAIGGFTASPTEVSSSD